MVEPNCFGERRTVPALRSDARLTRRTGETGSDAERRVLRLGGTSTIDLQPGENETHSKRANYSAGNRAVGGRLHVTDRHLVFEAHGFDKALGGKSVDVPLRESRRSRSTRRAASSRA